MSLFSSFKKALGFPDEIEDLEDDDISDLEDADDETVSDSITSECADINLTVEKPADDNDIMLLLNNIVSAAGLGNASAESLKIKEILETWCVSRNDEIRAKWAVMTSGMTEELHRLRKESSDFKAQNKELESVRLSTTRQKRAMNDRLADLENQITRLEAEHEQLVLENQSLVNRLRGSVDTSAMMSNNADMKRLTQENSTLRRELNIAKSMLEETQARMPQHDDEITAQAMKEIEEKLELFEEQKKAKDSQLVNFKNEVALLKAEKNELNSRSIKAENQVAACQEEIKQLKETIASNLRDNASRQAELTSEIKRLKDIIDRADLYTGRKSSKKKSKSADKTAIEEHVRISAIDELMDNTDWFVSPPPGPRVKDPEVTENFGYKEKPRRQNKSIDKNQPTLF